MLARLRKMSVQPSLTRSSSTRLPGDHRVEILAPFALPARLQRLRPVRIGRLVAAQVHRRRRALEDVQLLRVGADVRHALNRRRAGADDRDALVGELRQTAAVITAGVVVVPAAGVERVALELFDARHRRQLRPVQRARSPSRRSAPSWRRRGRWRRSSARCLRPNAGSVTLVWKQAVVVEIEVLAMRCECS